MSAATRGSKSRKATGTKKSAKAAAPRATVAKKKAVRTTSAPRARRAAPLRAAAPAAAEPRSFVPSDITPPAFAGAITGASAKHLALFQVVRARVSVHAAIQGLTGGAAEQRLGDEKWSARQLILHLVYWDREFLLALEPALRGARPAWAFESNELIDRRNADAVESLADLGWDDALRVLHAERQELMTALESVPEEPVSMWGAGHAFGWLVICMSRHDLHHAAVLKQWRAAVGV